MKIYVSLLFLLCVAACNEPEPQPPHDADVPQPQIDTSLELPRGFRAYVVVDSLAPRTRHLVVRDNGDIYVQFDRPKNGKSSAALRDENGDHRADRIEFFGNHPGTGIDIYQGYLYVSSDEAVYRYPLPKDALLPDESQRVLIAGGFPEQREHASKTFTFDGQGHLYVNVGAPSNACMEQHRTAGSRGLDPCPQLEWQAGIWRFDAGQLAQTQTQNGQRYASGIRNAVALAWNHQTNSLFVVMHGRDQLAQFWPDLFTPEQNAELPAEEFFEVREGDFMGWPYCYFDPLKNKKVLAPEYGGNGDIQGRCGDAKAPLMAFPAHLAPNDLLFFEGEQFPEKYRHGAFIAFHGSWNRAPLPQKGYFVAFVPFREGRPVGEWEIFAEGFAGGQDIASPGEARHRPCGLALGPDGSLYISDSVRGKIWKVVYEGSKKES